MMSCRTQQHRTNGSEAGSDQIHSWKRREKKLGMSGVPAPGSGEEEEEKGCDDEDGSASEGMKASPGLPGLGVADPDQRWLLQASGFSRRSMQMRFPSPPSISTAQGWIHSLALVSGFPRCQQNPMG